MACIFCEIVRGNIAAVKVMEDEHSLAFLDNRPLFPGHILLVPKQHYETLMDLPAAGTGPLFANAQLLAAAVEDALDAAGSFVAINNRISQSVPHLHVHVVPRRNKDGLKGFFWPRTPYNHEDEMEEVAVKLRSSLARAAAGK